MRPVPPAPSAERGSAYLIALMVLLLLTVLGVSVSLVTQMEVLLSSQERIVGRTFYAAESGLELSLSQALATGRFGPLTHVVRRSALERGKVLDVRERVESSPFRCLGQAPCHLCSINQGSRWVRRNHVVRADAIRLGLRRDGGESPLARKSLASGVDVEPVPEATSCLAGASEATGRRSRSRGARP